MREEIVLPLDTGGQVVDIERNLHRLVLREADVHKNQRAADGGNAFAQHARDVAPVVG